VITLLDVVTGWLLFLSLATAVGAVGTRWVVLPPGPAAGGGSDAFSPPELRARAARLGAWGGAAVLVALGLVFGRQLLEFHDPFAPWSDDARILLLDTVWGKAWLLALPVALVMLASFHLGARGRERAWWPATASALVLGAFPAFTGHADGGHLRAFTLPADILHVWAMGAWIGGLCVLLFLERTEGRGRGEGRPGPLPTLVPRFSPLAVTCVTTLVLTGCFAAWAHVGSVGALLGTGYGRLLLTKVTVALGVAILGALNWKRFGPRSGEPRGRRALRRSATLEFFLANAVLVVTAMLVRTSPR
jgi:copper transport protein